MCDENVGQWFDIISGANVSGSVGKETVVCVPGAVTFFRLAYPTYQNNINVNSARIINVATRDESAQAITIHISGRPTPNVGGPPGLRAHITWGTAGGKHEVYVSVGINGQTLSLVASSVQVTIEIDPDFPTSIAGAIGGIVSASVGIGNSRNGYLPVVMEKHSGPVLAAGTFTFNVPPQAKAVQIERSNDAAVVTANVFLNAVGLAVASYTRSNAAQSYPFPLPADSTTVVVSPDIDVNDIIAIFHLGL